MTLKEFRGRYRYDPHTDILGKGGFAKVYKAYDTLMQRNVAIKFYEGDIGDKYGVLEELKKVIGLKHVNLIMYYDAVSLASPSIYDENATMQAAIIELANAGDLNEYMKTFPSVTSLKKIVGDILKGLGHLHENGVIHRDIKPQNILLNRQNGIWTAKIADFGLAKRISQEGAQSSRLLGTMEYMAPEQFATKKFGVNGQLGTNVDLWSFGVILFEMFTGDLPFGGRNEGISHEQVMLRIMQKDIAEEIEDIIEPFQTIIRWSLVKKAGNRVANADELLKLLEGGEKVQRSISRRIVESSQSEVELSQAQKRWLFVGNVLLSPLLGLILFVVWRKKYKVKSQQALNLTWWSLAAWLLVLVILVFGMILLESNWLEQLK